MLGANDKLPFKARQAEGVQPASLKDEIGEKDHFRTCAH